MAEKAAKKAAKEAAVIKAAANKAAANKVAANKISVSQWREVLTVLGKHKIQSSATMTYGMGETLEEKVDQAFEEAMVILRQQRNEKIDEI